MTWREGSYLMGQPWQRWVDCSDGFGRARQGLVTVLTAGQLEVRLPAGEVVRLHRFQAEQLRTAVEQGMGVMSRAGAGS